jgi:capsular exopolysaccharide synthesis family protein
MEQSTAGMGDLLDAVRRRKWTTLLVAVPLFVGVVLYASSLPDEYEASAIVALSPRPGSQAGADVIRVIAPKYVAYVTSRPTLDQAARATSLQPAALRAGADAAVAPETANLTITVRLQQPAAAAAAANELARLAVQLAANDRLLGADVLVPAVEVRQPAGPPRRLLEAGGLAMALLAGITLAVIVDRGKPRITSAANLAQVTGHRTLGSIPRTRMLRNDLIDAMVDPAVSAAVGALRVQVDSESRIQPLKVLAVTSPFSGDGKTTVAATLALAVARLDMRVLLVDGDLRRPRVAEALRMGDDWGVGLAEVLEGAPRAEAGRQVGPGSLRVLPTDARADAGTLLARRLESFLHEVRAEYDLVVVDCPPLLATDDALTIAVHCDATLIVVSHSRASADAAAAIGKLEALGVRVLGAVLNRARTSARAGAYGTYGT